MAKENENKKPEISLEEEEDEDLLFEADDEDEDEEEFELEEITSTEAIEEGSKPREKVAPRQPPGISPATKLQLNEKESMSVVPVPTATGKPLSLNDVSLTLTVELAQLTITAQTLLDLQPGNMLDLATPGNQALLTIKDKIVGKGEIIKVGDMVGVRILEMCSY
jgi:flagellar motor switch protein FliN/FliY